MNKVTMIGLAVGGIFFLGIGGFYLSTQGTESLSMSEENKVMEEKKDEMMDVSKSDEMMNGGYLAPTFSLMDTKGNTVNLVDLKGEKVYVKFWASWCSICLAGLEDVDALSREDNGFRVITIVSPGYKGEQSKEDFIKWFEGTDVKNLIVLIDEEGQIAREYGVRAYPTSAYIGSDGILIKTLPGHTDNDSVKKSIFEFK